MKPLEEDTVSLYDEENKKEWEKLGNVEREIAKIYKEVVVREIAMSPFIMAGYNGLIAKYPDFHIGCIP